MCGLINTPAEISALIDTLVGLPTSPPSLYINLEGVNLSRFGSVPILQLLVKPTNKTHLLDVHVLGDEVFSTPETTNDQTSKSILELTLIPKVFFDVRTDSDALFSYFNINLTCIVDLQPMKLASRTFQKKFVKKLSKCIERDLPLTFVEKQKMENIKRIELKLFTLKLGGSYEVFNIRPLLNDLKLHCLQDVAYMPRLEPISEVVARQIVLCSL